MSSTKPLVSVVIPVYKAEDTLAACLEGLLQQSYTRLELLFVDDCSPDRSAALLQEMQPLLEAAGMQVKLLRHEVNKGVACARNTALEAATGDYLYALDADDILAPKALELLVSRAEETGADIVGCEWILREELSERRMTLPEVHHGAEAFRLMCQGKLKWNLWLYLLRRSCVEASEPLRFLPQMNMGEDMMFMGKLFHRAARVEIVHQPFYTYVRNPQSLTAQYKEQHWLQVQTNVASLEHYLQAEGHSASTELLAQLKLNLKLPLLISTAKPNYAFWRRLWPEVNALSWHIPQRPLRTRMLEQMASWGIDTYLYLYNKLVMQWLYSLLYR